MPIDIKDIKENAAFLMTPPEYFRFIEPSPDRPPANDFVRKGWEIYSADPVAFKKKAFSQWTELGHVITNEMDACVLEVEPDENLRLQVFSADPSLTLTNNYDKCVTLLSKFSNHRRIHEVKPHKDFFASNFPDHTIVEADFNIEGTGDNVYDPYRKLFWSGFTTDPGKETAKGRSDIRSHEQLAEVTNTPVISLNVQRPFFHIDTTLTPLSGGHILFHKEGINPEFLTRFYKTAFDKFDLPQEEFLIPVSAEDAKHFACNAICQDKAVIMSSCSDELQAQIRAKGYKLHIVDVSYFILSGGGPHCMTNNIKCGL